MLLNHWAMLLPKLHSLFVFWFKDMPPQPSNMSSHMTVFFQLRFFFTLHGSGLAPQDTKWAANCGLLAARAISQRESVSTCCSLGLQDEVQNLRMSKLFSGRMPTAFSISLGARVAPRPTRVSNVATSTSVLWSRSEQLTSERSTWSCWAMPLPSTPAVGVRRNLRCSHLVSGLQISFWSSSTKLVCRMLSFLRFSVPVHSKQRKE